MLSVQCVDSDPFCCLASAAFSPVRLSSGDKTPQHENDKKCVNSVVKLSQKLCNDTPLLNLLETVAILCFTRHVIEEISGWCQNCHLCFQDCQLSRKCWSQLSLTCCSKIKPICPGQKLSSSCASLAAFLSDRLCTALTPR